MVAKGEGGGEQGEKCEEIKNYRLAVTKQSWKGKIQHRGYGQ